MQCNHQSFNGAKELGQHTSSVSIETSDYRLFPICWWVEETAPAAATRQSWGRVAWDFVRRFLEFRQKIQSKAWYTSQLLDITWSRSLYHITPMMRWVCWVVLRGSFQELPPTTVTTCAPESRLVSTHRVHQQHTRREFLATAMVILHGGRERSHRIQRNLAAKTWTPHS